MLGLLGENPPGPFGAPAGKSTPDAPRGSFEWLPLCTWWLQSNSSGVRYLVLLSWPSGPWPAFRAKVCVGADEGPVQKTDGPRADSERFLIRSRTYGSSFPRMPVHKREVQLTKAEHTMPVSWQRCVKRLFSKIVTDDRVWGHRFRKSTRACHRCRDVGHLVPNYTHMHRVSSQGAQR